MDAIVEQWAQERPDLDLAPMALLGRAARVSVALMKEFDAFAARYGFTAGEVDVLFALRRSGSPYTLTPSELARTLMLSPAGITNRIDKLERAGLVTRALDPDDRRSFRVALTAEAVALADEIVTEHVANEARLLEALSPADRKHLDRVLRKLLQAFLR